VSVADERVVLVAYPVLLDCSCLNGRGWVRHLPSSKSAAYSRRVLLPPILEVFVVWHPDDELGEWVAATVADHFHSAPFAGLAGGAVEVYVRSASWDGAGSPPRPMPFMEPLPYGLRAPEFTAVVPVVSTHFARAHDDHPAWQRYVDAIAEAHGRDGVGVYTVVDPDLDLSRTGLMQALSRPQTLPQVDRADPTALCRELAQGIAQRVAAPDGTSAERITVFVSHTKHRSLAEDDEDGPRLYDQVRQVIAQTRLSDFFDARDLQTADDWASVLDDKASTSALLIVRTDRYAGREWTQREVLQAKLNGMPAVTLYAMRDGEDRGSFLMDHLPAVACNLDDPDPAISAALNRLVDEALKRALWRAQTVYLIQGGFDWLPAHAPEPVTAAPWLREHRDKDADDRHVWIIHPDPPLGPKERDVLVELCGLAGFDANVDILTPRTFASRGGRLRS